MDKTCNVEEKVIESFKQENRKAGIRVFVAGGSRSGKDPIYIEEAYNLGQKIVKMDFKLDFGLSNSGIMGAVAKGVLDGWNKKQCKEEGFPIQGITTQKYFELYPSDDDLIKKMDILVADTLEERKQKLLEADFVVFAPGGVGTLDELAYDCVAMQDGMIAMKPFILYNINGFFHHLLEYLKSISAKGFSDPVPFIVVESNEELEIAFRLIKLRYTKSDNALEIYATSRQIAYELPYYIKQKEIYNAEVEDSWERVNIIKKNGSDADQQILRDEIEVAYLEKEIERMYDRLATAGRDTGIVSEKLTALRRRRKAK